MFLLHKLNDRTVRGRWLRETVTCLIFICIILPLISISLLDWRSLQYTALNLPLWSIYRPLWRPTYVTSETPFEENTERLKEAKMVLADTHYEYFETMKTLRETRRSDVVITIPTQPRVNTNTDEIKEYGYLTQAVAALLHRHREYTQQSLSPLKFSVLLCNTYTKVDNYEELNEVQALVRLPQVNPYRGSDWLRPATAREKMGRDHAACLNHSLTHNNNNSKYIVMLEDDSLVQAEFFPQLEEIIARTELEKYLYIKLFHPEKWLNWNYSVSGVVELVILAAVMTAGSTYLWVIKSELRKCRRERLLHPNVLEQWLRASLANYKYVILLLLFLGRQNYVVLYTYLGLPTRIIPAPSCCSPALLYTRDNAAFVVQSLLDRYNANHPSRVLGYDTQLDRIASDNSRSVGLVSPSLVSHIGSFSSYNTKENKNFLEFIGIRLF